MTTGEETYMSPSAEQIIIMSEALILAGSSDGEWEPGGDLTD